MRLLSRGGASLCHDASQQRFHERARIIRRPEASTFLSFTVTFATPFYATTRTISHAQTWRIPVDRHAGSQHADGSVELERQPRCQTLYDLDGLSGRRTLLAVL